MDVDGEDVVAVRTVVVGSDSELAHPVSKEANASIVGSTAPWRAPFRGEHIPSPTRPTPSANRDTSHWPTTRSRSAVVGWVHSTIRSTEMTVLLRTPVTPPPEWKRDTYVDEWRPGHGGRTTT